MPNEGSNGALDIILAVAAVVTLWTLVRSWKTLWDEEFTVADRRIASQVAVFLIPPIVVLFHELAHYLTAIALSVEVTDFNYGLFHGSVSVAGQISAGEIWWIALSGNLVSAGAGLAMLVVGARAGRLRRSVRYLLAFGGVLELAFSLVVYPVMSLLFDFGDWVAIYDRDPHPVLFWATAAVHAGILVALFNWWRTRGKTRLFAIVHGLEDEQDRLRKAVETSPGEIEGWLNLVNFYGRYGELTLARSALDDAVAACGDTARLHLGRARVAMFQRRWSDAMVAAQRGLNGDVGDEEVRQRLLANLALALTLMERPDHALDAYGQLTPPVADDPRVRYGRGMVRLGSGDMAGGQADMAVVVSTLPEGDLLRRWAEARLDGRELEIEPDRRLPNYMRSSTPPPAPLAGI